MGETEGMSRITVAGTGKCYINSIHGLGVKEDENLNKIVADISRPEPRIYANKQKGDLKGVGKKQSINRKINVDENHNDKNNVEKSSGSGGWIKQFQMLDLKSLD